MKKRVAVLRGGPSSEHDVSLLSGAAVLQALTDSGYDCRDIVITRDAEWLHNGRMRTPAEQLLGVDVVFIALHGTYGEDGQVQRLLEQLQIPYTGSGALTSALAFDKIKTKELVLQQAARTPNYRPAKRHHLKDPRFITQLEADLGTTLFVKPVASGSSDGSAMISDADSTFDVIAGILNDYDEVLIEEYIAGTEATVGVLEYFRGEELYALPVVEIIPPEQAGFFDRQVKYDGSTKEIVPADIHTDIRDELQRIARLAHQELGCRHYSRSDFLIRDGEIFFLETNTLPGLTSESLFPKAADAVGLPFRDLVVHLVEVSRT